MLFDCQKASIFIFSKRIHADFFSDGVPDDKQRHFHSVDFQDSFSIEKTKVLTIARSEEELCTKILYPSIVKIHRDAIRKKESLAVCIRQHKREGEISCILQIELAHDESYPDDRSNSPSKGDDQDKSKSPPAKRK